MKIKAIILALLLFATSLQGKVQEGNVDTKSGVVHFLQGTSVTNWQRVSYSERKILLSAINHTLESDPHEGTIIRFGENKRIGPYINIIFCGSELGFREELTGVPEDGHPKDCPLCKVPAVKKYYGNYSYEHVHLIESLNHTPLLIPVHSKETPAPIHWGDTDLIVQEALLNAALEIIFTLEQQYPNEKFGMELHSGSKGGQTVWHTHLRITCEKPWDSEWIKLFE